MGKKLSSQQLGLPVYITYHSVKISLCLWTCSHVYVNFPALVTVGASLSMEIPEDFIYFRVFSCLLQLDSGISFSQTKPLENIKGLPSTLDFH
jgi:hypothetical protein